MNRSADRATKRLRLVTLAPVVLLVAGVSVSLLANQMQRDSTVRQRSERFDTETTQLADNVVGEVDRYDRLATDLTVGVQLPNGQRTTAAQFSTYADTLVLDSRFPGTFGIAWADSVPVARLQQFLADPSVPTAQLPELSPDENHATAAIVTFAEPDSTMSIARGVDGRLFPPIAAVLDASASTGSDTVSQPFALPLENGPDRDTPPILTFLMHPVYAGVTPDDPAARLAAISAWTTVALNTQPFVEHASGSLGTRYVLSIHDGSDADHAQLSSNGLTKLDRGQARTISREVYGRIWNFDIAEAKGIRYGDAEPSNWLLWMGLGITGAGFLIVLILTRAEHVAQRRVRRATTELAHRATHDSLTGLVNRAELADAIQRALEDSHTQSVPAVLFLDLDRFKLINDSHGHSAGDQLLIDVADRLTAAVGPSDLVARIGGDEFVILTRCGRRADAERLAAIVEEALSEPFDVAGQEHFARASIGIATATLDSTADALLRYADAAMYAAKHGERRRVASFTPDLLSRSDDRLMIINDLRRAIDGQQFVLAYQPVVEVATGTTVGFEALIRWMHPDRGLLLPGAFLPIATDAGLITEIDQWVRRTATAQAARWADAPNAPWISVNVSARELGDEAFAQSTLQIVADAGLDPRRLVIEITETDLARDRELASRQLSDLREAGMLIAVDDFGTGYSGFSNLRSLPADILKLDRSLVSPAPDDPADEAILRAVVEVGHALGLGMIAEGVETAAQLGVLVELGCHLAQGWFFGQEMDAEQAARAVFAVVSGGDVISDLGSPVSTST